MSCPKTKHNVSARRQGWNPGCSLRRESSALVILKAKNNQRGCKPLNLENKLWNGVMRHCSYIYYIHALLHLPSDFRVPFAANIDHLREFNHQMRDRSPHRELHYPLFSSMKELRIQNETVQRLETVVTQAYLHVLHYMYLYMSSLCCSQIRHDHFVRWKVTCETKPSKWFTSSSVW